MIYRAGATPLLSDADLATIGTLRLNAMVDLRSDEERQLAPTRIDGVRYTAVGYSMKRLMAASGSVPSNGSAVYRGMPVLLTPQLRLVFDLLKRHEGPIEYNCSAGQDRTGFVTAIVLSALGTPREVIVKDYLASTALRRPEYEMPRFDPAAFPDNYAAKLFSYYQSKPELAKPQPLMEADGTPFLLAALDEVEKRWGSVDGYLKQEIGLTDADIATLRANYTE
jgi:protein-tyrosine phosphatase